MVDNLPFKLGNVAKKVFEVFRHEFSTIDEALNFFVAFINLNNKWGIDLDKTGIMFGIIRKNNESDVDYRQRMLA